MADARAAARRLPRPARQRAGRQRVPRRRHAAERGRVQPARARASRSSTKYSDQIAERMRADAGLRRRRHHALGAQARAAGRDRPRARVGARPPRRGDRRDAAACWSAASRSRSTRRRTSSTTSGCAPSPPTATIPRDVDDLTVCGARRRSWCSIDSLVEPRARRAARRRSSARTAQRKVGIVANLDGIPLGGAVEQGAGDRQRAGPAAAVPDRVRRPRQGARRDRARTSSSRSC